MWEINCGCNHIVQQPYEFPIFDNDSELLKDVKEFDISAQYPGTSTLCELKEKIICDFYKILDQLECGIQPDLEFLLEEISFVHYDRILFEQKQIGLS